MITEQIDSIHSKALMDTLQGGLLQPGDCWAFKGKDGKLSIELAKKIYVTAVTIEHLPQAYLVQESIKAAPRHFTVYVSILLHIPFNIL